MTRKRRCDESRIDYPLQLLLLRRLSRLEGRSGIQVQILLQHRRRLKESGKMDKVKSQKEKKTREKHRDKDKDREEVCNRHGLSKTATLKPIAESVSYRDGPLEFWRQNGGRYTFRYENISRRNRVI